jgi:alpha-glucosidase
VQVQSEDPDSLLNLYRRLIWFRKSSTALQTGKFEILDGPPGCLVYQRQAAGECLWIALNFNGKPVDLSVSGGGELVMSSISHVAPKVVEAAMTVEAYQGVIVRCTPVEYVARVGRWSGCFVSLACATWPSLYSS